MKYTHAAVGTLAVVVVATLAAQFSLPVIPEHPAYSEILLRHIAVNCSMLVTLATALLAVVIFGSRS